MARRARSRAIILLIGYFVAREHGRVATTGSEGLIGELVEVREAIAPDSPGKVFVHGEIWRARSDDVLPPGAHARDHFGKRSGSDAFDESA